MKTVYIIRDYVGKNQSLGTLLVKNEGGKIVFDAHLLELGWQNNKRNISCVLEGEYSLRLEWSPKFKTALWEAYGIPNRNECKFHQANFAKQLNGCFAPGDARFDINRDGNKDVVNSALTLTEFHNSLGMDKKARLVVINDQF